MLKEKIMVKQLSPNIIKKTISDHLDVNSIDAL